MAVMSAMAETAVMAAVMAVMAVTVGMLVAAPTDVDMSALMLKRTAAGREAERSTAKWLGGIEASEAMEALVVRRSGTVARTAMPRRHRWTGVMGEGCGQRGREGDQIPE